MMSDLAAGLNTPIEANFAVLEGISLEDSKRLVQIWKSNETALLRIKLLELQNLSDARCAQIASRILQQPPDWTSPERLSGSGLVDQQRIFMKAHALIKTLDQL
jgi:hypothetical protein